jgi:hypothetical protein
VRFAAFPSRSVSPPGGGLYPARLSRDALTLRRIPLVSSRTASPRPLPSCRYCSLRRHFVSAGRLVAEATLASPCDPKATGGSRPPRLRAGAHLLLPGSASLPVRPEPLEMSQTSNVVLMVRLSFTPDLADLPLPCSRRDRAPPAPVARPEVPRLPPRWLARRPLPRPPR